MESGISAIVAIIGAVFGLFIFRQFGQKKVESEQKKLQTTVDKNKEKDAELRRQSTEVQAREQQQVKEIEDEQKRDVTSDDLVDFFNNRKGK